MYVVQFNCKQKEIINKEKINVEQNLFNDLNSNFKKNW